MDECNCCSICLKVEGEQCGGFSFRFGRCDHKLYCNITGEYRRDPVGQCVPRPSYQHIDLQRQNIPTLVHKNTGAQTPSTYRYSSTTKIPKVLSNISGRSFVSIATNGIIRTMHVLNQSPTKEFPSSARANTSALRITGSPMSNKTSAFVSGDRRNAGMNKDTEATYNNPVDTKPAILFLIASSVLMAFLIVLVTCFDDRLNKRKSTLDRL